MEIYSVHTQEVFTDGEFSRTKSVIIVAPAKVFPLINITWISDIGSWIN